LRKCMISTEKIYLQHRYPREGASFKSSHNFLSLFDNDVSIRLTGRKSI
jgi:hypothetical protein